MKNNVIYNFFVSIFEWKWIVHLLIILCKLVNKTKTKTSPDKVA